MHTQTRNKRNDKTLEKEIELLSNLIRKRWVWLNTDANKNRRTYSAVLKDTQEMEEKLQSLKED
jgi:hypothetical protein